MATNLRAAAAVLLQVVSPRICQPGRVLGHVAMAARAVVKLGVALAGAAAGVQPVLHDLALAWDDLVVDPAPKVLHAGGELGPVFLDGSVRRPALEPALVDVDVDEALVSTRIVG